jgi:GNAT superfamily N-acetyltransferase
VAAALEGGFGRATVDDVNRPTVAVLDLDLLLVAGDPDSASADELVRSLPSPSSVLVHPSSWELPLRRLRRKELASYRRVGFSPAEWDRAEVARWADALPDGFSRVTVDAGRLAEFEELEPFFTRLWPDREAFLERGVGLAIEQEGRIVSGASSFTLGGGKLEIGVATHPDFRRRGLGFAVSAAMIGHCLDEGLLPCWDAATAPSAFLGEKLGFVDPEPYEAYFLK